MFDVLAAQLAAMRAQIGALQVQIGGLQAQVDVLTAIVDEQRSVEMAAEECRHENTEDEGSTLAESRRRCLECGKLIVETAETA